jgi:hypothetical protein
MHDNGEALGKKKSTFGFWGGLGSIGPFKYWKSTEVVALDFACPCF